MTLKNKQFGWALITLIYIVTSFSTSLGMFLITPSVEASGEKYILYYPDDDASKAAIRDAYDKEGSDEFKDPAMTKVSILAHGGTLFKDGPQRLVYDPDVNYSLSNHGTGDGDDNNEQFFTRVYYCDSSGKVGFSKPTGTESYIRITYAIGLYIKDSKELFNNKTHNDNAVGATKIVVIQPSVPGGAGQAPAEEKETVIKDLDENAGPQNLDDDIGNINIAACRPSPVGEDKINITNYYNNTPTSDKEAIKSLLAAADAGGQPGGSNSSTKTEEDACNATGSPMSWIICPIIDMGSKFTDFVFNDIVRPFLEDVPISSNPDDPSYNAWKQFRLIGNIVLIGSLMAVVYAQARGDK